MCVQHTCYSIGINYGGGVEVAPPGKRSPTLLDFATNEAKELYTHSIQVL